MNNFLFKSANGLIKNSSSNLDNRMDLANMRIQLLLKEQRHQRSDLRDIKLMLNKLLIDKHLQNQVDEYFTEKGSEGIPSEPEESDLD